ncbi:MAG: HIT family protein [Planctomycetota bacterium]|jgi:diadenosine tetraphosphate (Ap4A) HIT family hydrolase
MMRFDPILYEGAMAGFEIHPQLLEDCHVLGRLGVCHLLLNRNATLPWFVLVPEVETTHFHEIDPELRTKIEDEVNALSRFVMSQFDVIRVNSAAIGNVVQQVHLHVIGRYEADPCWPGVVWGMLPSGPIYDEPWLEEITVALVDRCGLRVG